MKLLSVKFSVLYFCIVLLANSALAQDSSRGLDWKPLFDGKSIDSWIQRGGKAKYEIIDEAIVGTSVPNTPNSFLCTEKNYTDFALDLEYKVHPELNSGIQIRSNSLPDYRKGRVHGYQVEIDPSDRSFSAGIFDEARNGWLFDLKQNNPARYAFKQNDWNHVQVFCKGNRIVTYLNGVKAADLKHDETSEGFIALQVHGVGKRKKPLDVSWRKIMIAEQMENFEFKSDPASPEKFSGEIVSAGVEAKKLSDGFKFTEGASLGPDGRIYFSDIPNNKVMVYDPESEALETYRENSKATNGMMWMPNDALISCEGKGRRVSRHMIGGGYNTLAEKFNGKRLNSPNDLDVDNFAGIYFSDPRYGDREDMEMEVEGVYYINRQRKLTRIIDDLERPNGLILSPDYSTLYVADQAANKTFKYDVKKPGVIENKTEFAPIGSDGMTIDDFGNVYLTNGKFVHAYSPEGKELAKIEFPEMPANVTFGGKDRSTLFVTARKGFYSIKTNVSGGKARANPK